MLISSALFVVEGVTDIQFLSTFIQAEFIITNGSEIPMKTIEYIQTVFNSKRQVIVLTDPDAPGQRIRSVLDSHMKGLSHVFIQKKDAIRKNKVGVAQSTPSVILEALSHIMVEHSKIDATLTNEDLLALNLLGTKDATLRRDFVSRHFHIGHTNAKTLLKRLNNLSISNKELTEALKTYEISS
jgi:ribonuclease M5